MNPIEKYRLIRSATERICAPLQIDDYSIQVVTFASPAKWHLAHTTWFFEAFILKEHYPDYQEFDTDFNFLFNSYYNNAGARILQSNRGNMSRPSTEKTYEYRKYVDSKIEELLQNKSTDELIDLLILGLNHEQQHQELLYTDIKYMLGHNPLFPAYKKNVNLTKDTNTTSGYIKINAGEYKIGHQKKSFSYDNELGAHRVYLNQFEICNELVTNRDYINFIESGAYSDFNIWLDDAWSWIKTEKIEAPLYWHKIGNEWYNYTLSGLIKIEPDAILSHISFYEANAFAQWSGMRLPTEFEWEIASTKLKWGKRWEWTASAYLPYPNFKKAAGAVGEYNGKFMSNRMVLRGASVATPENHSRNTYRNFFHPHERWQYTGIRLVK